MRRVVITGLGVVTPIGIGTDRFFKAMTVGKSGIGKAVGFSTDLYRTCMVGEVTDFVDTREQWGRCSQLAVAAAAEALTDSGLLDDNSVSGEEIGVSIGTLIAEAQVLEKIDETWARSGFAAVDPDELKRFPTYSVSNNVANAFRLRGPNVMIPTACAAGNYAIAYACDQIRFGNARAMVAGGSDAISQIIYTGFNRLLSLSPDCCRPFDKNRKGLIVGEGAGMLVLEDLDNARRRGATIYAEVYGYGMTCSAYHMTAPHPEGLGAARAMGMALEQGGVDRTKIDYISAHGTG
ncbi:MAG: beta-ketoacyl-[acyl-carrier-protein] synthase family protein, partial [Desulfuromonadaceae bacterium]